MIHIVDPQTSEILDYITLDKIIEDTHKKSLESYIETYDAIVLGGNDFSYDKHLEKRNHIIIPDEDGTYQEFILFEVDKYRDTEGRKTHFYAHATYLELKKAKVIYPTRREGFTLSQHAGWALNDTGWTVGIVESEGVRTFNIENHTNPYEFLKRLANEFEVEIRFRVEHDGRRITARYVDFLERIGDWKGREVEFGRDLDSIRRVEKQDIVTALLGLGPEREDGTRLEVLVEDEEALQRWGRVDEHGNLHHLIEPYEIQSERQEMTEEEARQYTRTALDKRINTQVTYETTILDLEEVPGLEHEKIRFGDTIRIKDTYFNPPLYIEARVFEIERSIKNKAKKDIKLGDYIEYTEEEINAIWNQLRNEIRRRLDRMAIVTINSTAGNVFKNAQGETELTVRTFVNGAERDEDGTLYDYQWMRFDKHGNHDTEFYAEGKTITVKASDIDEKATYRVLVAYELEVINTAEITISNVFDGEDGEPGPPGPKGDKGDKGDPGPQGPPGTSITSIIEYYLATNQSSGVTIDTPGWTTTMQQMTPTNRYLWNYERINFSDGTYQNTNPVIIGVYGDEGEEGRSVVDITEYYLATDASSGVTRDTSGWTTTMQVTTPEKRYLWNYEEITWNKEPIKTYTEPVIIGVHGEQGEKGEDGQGVDNITIEYYLSDSDSTPIGGTWTETKPTYQPGKYLWIRQKITYKNPTAIEYTTPVLDDSWKAVEIADEAKQEAEEANQTAQQAKTTADGKNKIIPSKTEPPTEGRKIGDVWFQEMPDGSLVIHDFNGVEWVKRQFGEQSIIANSITANHIKSLVGLNVNDQFIVDSQGNVKFAGSLEGASGTFGDVTVTDGDFNLQDAVVGTKYSATPRRNLIKDHSFEMVKADPSSLGPDSIRHNWLDMADNETYQDSEWYKVGSPKVATPLAPDHRNALPIFGEKAIVVRNANYVRQYVWEGIGANSQYTVSAHFKRQWNTSPGIPRIEIWHVNALGNRISKIVNATFPRVKTDYSVQLNSVTFTVPSSFETMEMLEVIISGGDDNWVQCDGVQMNEGTRASVYLPEDTIWDMHKGYFLPKSRGIMLWAGQSYPTASQTIYPDKKLQDCANGWILQWQRYVYGQGTQNSNFHYTFIPKTHAMYNSGYGIRVPLPEGTDKVITKYIYVYNDRIVGHDNNNDTRARNRALTGVYEF